MGILSEIANRVAERLKRRRTFFAAVQKGLTGSLRRVIEEGQDVDEVDGADQLGLQRRAIHYAVQHKKIEIIEILMLASVDVSATDNNGKTAFHYACQNMDQYLTQCASSKVQTKRTNAWLSDAVLPVIPAESVAMIKAMVKSYFVLEQKSRFNLKKAVSVADNNGQTCLHLACISSMPPVVELLCDGGSDPSAFDTLMRTPLHLASWVGSADCIRVLLRYNGDVHTINKVGRTPLHVAACFGWIDCCKCLLDHGAAIDAVNNNLNTPLHLTLFEDKAECATFLIQSGAETFVPNRFGESALRIACELNPKLAKVMLDTRRSERRDEMLMSKQVYATYDMTGLDRAAPSRDFDTPPDSALRTFSTTHSSRDSVIRRSATIYPSEISIPISLIQVPGLGRFHEVSAVAFSKVGCSRLNLEADCPKSPRTELCKKAHSSPLNVIVANGERALISHPVVLKALTQKWVAFAQRSILKDTLTHLLILVCWMGGTIGWGESLETSCETYSFSHGAGRGGILHAAALWLYFLLIFWRLQREIWRGVLRGVMHESFWVLFDLVFFVLSLGLGLPMHVLAHTTNQSKRSCMLAQGFYSLISLLVWFRCVQFLGVRKLCGPYVRILGKMWRDMVIFVIVFVFIMLGFAHAFYLAISSSGQEGHRIEEFSSFSESVLQTYMMFAGIFSFYSLSESQQRPWASVMYAVFYMIAPILMINLMICMLFQTYDSVKEDSFKEWLLEWASKIIVASRRHHVLDQALPSTCVEIEEPQRQNTLTVSEQTLNSMNDMTGLVLEMKKELEQIRKTQQDVSSQLMTLTQSMTTIDSRLMRVEKSTARSSQFGRVDSTGVSTSMISQSPKLDELRAWADGSIDDIRIRSRKAQQLRALRKFNNLSSVTEDSPSPVRSPKIDIPGFKR